jgi:hypothetical protein
VPITRNIEEVKDANITGKHTLTANINNFSNALNLKDTNGNPMMTP